MFRRVGVADRAALLVAISSFAQATGGRLDVLFNNAGIDAEGTSETMAWEKVVGVVNVNVLGALSLIHGAIPQPTATKGSLCVSTASASAIFGAAGMAVYSATKHAVKGFTEALAVELASAGAGSLDTLFSPVKDMVMLGLHAAFGHRVERVVCSLQPIDERTARSRIALQWVRID